LNNREAHAVDEAEGSPCKTPKKFPKSFTHVLATKQKDKGANIPTEQLRDFVEDQEKTPKTILYPRNPSLDPQRVWKVKDK
jgi:adenine-specific DNA-methyltransferase